MRQDFVMALVDAFAKNDHDRFRSVALSIAANEESRSPVFAKRMRATVDRRNVGELIALPADVAGLFMPPARAVTMEDLVLDEITQQRLDVVISEQAAYDKLFVHGLEPSRKLLFVGPPGVGKTMSAYALAHRLQLPMRRVALHGVISSHLGETAGKLAKVFEQVRIVRGVYLFDEIDALVPSRAGDDRHDVAEMRRVVNSFLQMLEDDDGRSMIIAATNHAQLLDKALFRRFNEVIEFAMPSRQIAQRLIWCALKHEDAAVWASDDLLKACVDLSHADICAGVRTALKLAVLSDRNLAPDDLRSVLGARRTLRNQTDQPSDDERRA